MTTDEHDSYHTGLKSNDILSETDEDILSVREYLTNREALDFWNRYFAEQRGEDTFESFFEAI